MLPIPATRIRDVVTPRRQSHAADLQVAPGIRDRHDPNHRACEYDDGRSTYGYPTHHRHFLPPFDKRFDFVGCEVQVAAVPVMQVGGRIVLEDNADVLIAVD